MALIKCSECGKEISDKATTCIHCGNPILQEKVKTMNKKKWEDLNYEDKNKIIAYRKTLKQWWCFERFLPLLIMFGGFLLLIICLAIKLMFSVLILVIIVSISLTTFTFVLSSKEQKKWYNNNIDKIYKNQIIE